MPLVTPQNSIGPVLVSTGPIAGLVVFAVVAGTLAYVMMRGDRRQRITGGGLFAGSIAFYTLAVISNPNSFYEYARFDRDELARVWLVRYGVVPSMMLAAITVLAISVAVSRRRAGDRHPRLGNRRMLTGSAALAVVAALLLVQFVPQDTRRSAGPQWSPQVTAAEKSCERLPGTYVFHLSETISWHVWLSCRVIDPPGA